MKSKKFYLTLLLEVTIVAVIALFIFVDMKDIYKFFVGDTTFYHQDKNCDLHLTSCEVKFPEQRIVHFDIEPKEIPLMKPLTFTLTTSQNFKPENFELNIYATNMNMGYHSFILKKDTNGSYKAAGILPDCLVGGMIWNAEVVNNSATKSEGAMFSFKTK